MNEKICDVYIAEFESLRDEVFSRFEFQRQAFNYLMALFGAFVAILAAEDKLHIDQRFVLVVPLISSPLCYIFFDNEILIWSIGRYINEELTPKLSTYLDTDVLLLERRRGLYLTNSIKTLHSFLSVGRWILFFIPSVAPIILSFKNGWTQGSALFTIILVADIVLTLILIWAVVSTIKMRQKAWSKKNNLK